MNSNKAAGFGLHFADQGRRKGAHVTPVAVAGNLTGVEEGLKIEKGV